ncbi:MAG: methylated-DNA--[protein]-cysteine S-methyltransferase [Alphaproteobacteria bacterium]|nr:methylated-DNA--[protein]-cysteine S-methyltransferase [Alphaproteobacteria bacterium]
MLKYATLETPIGIMTFIDRGGEICAINVGDAPEYPATAVLGNTRALSSAKKQMMEYFKGRRTDFDLPLMPVGTKFQMNVWRELSKIPFGKLVSYGDIARAIGLPAAHRAVGTAVGKNPIPIIIPCHRVITSGAKIGGFRLGLPMKRQLLQHEMPLFDGKKFQ